MFTSVYLYIRKIYFVHERLFRSEGSVQSVYTDRLRRAAHPTYSALSAQLIASLAAIIQKSEDVKTTL